ncbi:MAG: NAD(P)/FAD-dependent oxidoreductase, partial [Firmicutes bacterium]|nr:NAD(P)/FAD-dependent oxidoreductase [Bacillota bacterium]
TVKSADGRSVRSRRLLITGGGKAGIQFGSDGSAMKLAQGFGHSVVKPIPALVPMTVNEDISEMAGVRCEALISLTKKTDSKTEILAFNYFGEVQFTKDAVSGICVMDLSRNIRFDNNAVYTLTVDPLWDYEGEERRILLETMPLENLVPLKLAKYMQQHLKDRMEPLKFTVTGTKGWPDAQVTAGGVELSEVNPCTMESKLVPGLYFAGEVLNVDGPCGGYNLSFAFASGMLAADAIESSL